MSEWMPIESAPNVLTVLKTARFSDNCHKAVAVFVA
jgi:hypothetical protein